MTQPGPRRARMGDVPDHRPTDICIHLQRNGFLATSSPTTNPNRAATPIGRSFGMPEVEFGAGNGSAMARLTERSADDRDSGRPHPRHSAVAVIGFQVDEAGRRERHHDRVPQPDPVQCGLGDADVTG